MTDLSINPIDEESLAHNRLAHLRDHMVSAGLDLCVLTSPISIRYATGYRGYAAFQAHIPTQYLTVPVEGPVVLFGAYTDRLSTIDRCETAHSVTAFDAGLATGDAALRFTHDIERGLAESGLDQTSIVGIERLTPMGFKVLHGSPIRIADAEGVVELARSRKLPEEHDAIAYSVAVAELGIERMRATLKPGVTENQLFAMLHHTNIEHDGDWIDGRMLCSGPRTNPWYQEASARRIEEGDLVAFDTDMIGPNGYCADISRTWVCGDSPTPSQFELYRRARAEIEHNIELLKVGASFRDLSDRSFRQPDEFIANRYACVLHGVGMSDEFPKIPYPQDWHWTGYDGELEAGTVLSVESYVGAEGGAEGVKLEQMVQVTDDGVIPLSTSPLWDDAG
ncbi:MAG: aminopeptidase P family protein [Acidimicrobiales bacterium]|nr:aminopeptidase P family protein [Acidimicrobiales bacterium]